MSKHNAGTVSAKIELDTKDFQATLDQMMDEMNEVKGKFKEVTDEANGKINKLKKDVSKLREENNELKNSANGASGALKDEVANLKKLSPEYKKHIKDIKNTIKANKDLANSTKSIGKNWKTTLKPLKEIEQQSKKTASALEKAFTRDLWKSINAHMDSNKRAYTKPIFEELFGKYGQYTKDIKQFERLFFKAMQNVGATAHPLNLQSMNMKDYEKYAIKFKSLKGKGYGRIEADNLKSVQQIKDELNGVTTSVEKYNQSLTKTIILNKKISSSPLKINSEQLYEFEKHLYEVLDLIATLPGGQKRNTFRFDLDYLKTAMAIFADAIGMGNELNALLERGLSNFGAKVISSKGAGNWLFEITDLKEPLLEEAKAVDKITESTEKATKATKDLTVAQEKLTTPIRYSFQELAIYFDLLPKKAQIAMNNIMKAIGKRRGIFGGYTGEKQNKQMLDEIQRELVNLPMVNVERFLNEVRSEKDRKESSIKRIPYDISRFKEYGSYQLLKAELGIVDDDVKKAIDYYKEQNIEIGRLSDVSLKATDSVKQIGVSEESTAKSTEKLTAEVKQLEESSKEATVQLGRELEIMNALGSETYNYLSNLKRGRKTKGVIGTDTALWKRHRGISGKVKVFDYNRYIQHMNNLFKDVLSPEEFEKQFKNFRQIYRIGEVLPFGGHGGIRGTTWRKLEQFDGVSSVEQLKKELEGVDTEVVEVTTDTKKLTEETKQLGEASKYTATQIKILKDIFSQVQSGRGTNGLYIGLERKYVRDLTGMGMDTVIAPHKLRSRFQREIEPLFKDLGLIFHQGVARMELPTIDTSNLISEEEFKYLIGEFEEVSAEEEKIIEKTQQLAGETRAYQIQLMGLANVIKAFNFGGRKAFRELSTEIINDLTRMAEANEYYVGSAQKVNHALKQVAKLKEGKYGFGFIGEDAKDAHYMESTLRALKEAEIKPIKIFDRDELEVLKMFYTEGKNQLTGGGGSLGTIMATGLFDVPSIRKLISQSKAQERDGVDRAGLERIYSMTDWIDPLEPKNYDKYLKEYHTKLRELMNYLNIQLSKSIVENSKGEPFKGKKIWNEQKGKFEVFRSIDFSNMIDLGTIEEFNDLLDKTASALDIFDKRGKNLSVTLDVIDTKTVEVKEDIKQLGESEKTTTTSTENLINSFRKAIQQANQLKKAVANLGYRDDYENMFFNPKEGQEFIDKIYRANVLRNHGKIDKETWESEIVKWGSLIKGFNIDGFLATFEDFSNVFRYLTPWEEVNKILNGVNKLNNTRIKIGDNWRVTFKSMGSSVEEAQVCLDSFVGEIPKIVSEEEKLVTETEKLEQSFKKFGKGRTQFIANMYGGTPNNAIESIIEDVEKRSEAVTDIALKILGIGNNAKSATKEVDKLVMAVQHIGEKHSISKFTVPFENFVATIKKASTGLAQLYNTVKLLPAHKFTTSTIRDFGIGTIDPPIEGMEGYIRFLQVINRLKEKLGEVTKEVKLLGTSTTNINESLSFGQLNPNHITNYSEQLNRLGRTAEKVKTDFRKLKDEMNIPFNGKSRKENIFQQLNRMDAEDSVLYKINSRYLNAYGLSGQNGVITQSEQPIANTTRALKNFDATVLTVARDIKEKLISSIKQLIIANKDNEDFTPPVHQWKQAINEIDAFIRRYEVLQQRMYELSRGMGKWRNQGKVNTGYGKLLEDMGLLNTEGSKGRINVEGYSDYVARIAEIKKSIESTTVSTNQYKESLSLLAEAIKLNANELTGFVGKSEVAVQAMTQMAEANERFAKTKTLGQRVTDLDTMLFGDKGLNGKGLGAQSGIISTLEHFSGLSNKNADKLLKFKNEAIGLKRTFIDLNTSFSEGTLSAEKYEAEITKLTEKVERLKVESQRGIRELNLIDPKKAEQANSSIKKSNQSLREFGKTASQDEQYVNNLYRGLQKARSIIISIKTIGRMMGGMALWNFAFELVESAKETYIAKNEMESLLEKNTKVNASGVQTYNKALDETVKRFQKINKYSLGETGASVGLEFNLNAQEMAKSLPIIAMVQSEYVRAGRTVEEASLAVKDILQGEFMRLSRETGIGKTDLMEKYGWNGDNTDVLNLMKALEKAGKERHWDVFAGKATSLNDVLTMTKSRFSELGAELATTAEPLIVGAFNGILGAIDGLKQGFEGLGSFGKNITLVLGSVSGIMGLTSAYLMLAKGMGAVDIATLGWSKSLASSLLQLNKTDVALHGFSKTLIATISGTKTATVAEIGFKKALVGRVLGLNQSIIATRGFSGALVNSISKLKEETPLIEAGNKIKGKSINLEKASLLTKDKSASITGKIVQSELTRSQRLAYLTTNLKYNEVAELSRGKAILKTATSWRVLRTAMLGVMAIGVATWFATVASWADMVKKNIEGFNNMVDNGDSLVKSAKSEWDSATKAIEEQNALIDEYNSKNKDTTQLLREKRALVEDETTAQRNYYNTIQANNLAKKKSEALDKRQSKINTRLTTEKAKALMAVGNTSEQASLLANNAYSEVSVGSYYANKALTEYKKSYEGLIEDAKEYGIALKAETGDQKLVNQFMDEYLLKAEEASNHLRQFNEGDLWAGAYYWLDRLTLEWIKFTHSTYGDKFFKSINAFIEWLKPSLRSIADSLKNIGKWAIDTLSWITSNDLAMTAVTWTGIGTAIAFAGLKLGKWVTGAKSTFDVAKKLGGKLSDIAKGWKDVGKNAEDAEKKTPKTTPEGTVPPTNSEYRYKDWGEWRADVKQDFMGNARNFFKYATQIAMAMTLVTEAILLLQLPMTGLAVTGWTFKQLEPEIKKGIEGLKVIAPVIGAFLPPAIALMYIMQKYGKSIQWNQMGDAYLKSVTGIAMGLTLVAEAILLLYMPMSALGGIGWAYKGMEANVKKGVEAMKAVTSSLIYLAPFIPAFILGVALMDAVFTNPLLGGSAILIMVGGIALGMLLVCEAIWTMQAPLQEIANIGANYPNLGNVEQGAKALKLVADSMTSVSVALGALVLIEWEILADHVARLAGISLGADLTQLTGDGGFFDQLNKFVEAFNSDDLKIETPSQDKVEAIKSAGEGIGAIGDAMKSIDTALHNLPREFTGEGETLNDKYQQAVGGQKTSTDVEEGVNYFDQFKEPIKQLGTFIHDFNTSEEFNIEPVDSARLEAIKSGATMITQVNDAVQQVKTAMQGVGDSQWNTAYAEGGILTAVGNYLFHFSGEGLANNGQTSGDYKSSLGSSLKAMEDIISDLFTFQSNISGFSSQGDGADVGGLTNMVTVISDAITNVSQSLSNAVPTFEGHGKSLSGAIVNGFKQNLKFGDVPAQIANQIMKSKDTLYNTASALGKTTGTKFKDGIDKMSEYMTWELFYVGQAIDGQKESLGQKAYDLGSYIASRFKEGDDINSPGIMARSMQDEINYIGGYLSTNNLPQMAFDLANALSSNFNLDFNLGNFQIPDITQWGSQLNGVLPIIDNLKTQVSTKFNTMKTNVQTSFNGILTKNQTSMSSMKNTTVKHISGITTSWKGMQTALIASAEYIKTQTSSKIDKLKSNMGEFWNKIKHPDLLISSGSAGGRPTGTIPQRRPFRGFAGAPIFKQKISKQDPSDFENIGEICRLLTGKPCYSGGWSFDWSPSISNKFKGWGTHFGQFGLDNHLNVGKFENSNFPVRGQLDVFKDYVSAVIGATNYDYYYDSRYSPVEALRRGAFNCWDGTQVILAIARAFGIGGGGIGHGTWGKDGHVWATIPGIGVIDPTAIQRGYGFKSPKVKGYGAGGTTSRSSSGGNPQLNGNNTYNTNIEIHVHGNDVEVNDKKIDRETGRQIIDILGINPATGR